MAWAVAINKEKRLVICSFNGKITASDAAEARDSIPRNPEFQPEFDHLIDLSGISTLSITGEEMRALARVADPFSYRSVRVLVAPTDVLFGMARMYDAAGEREHPNQVVVRTLDEAYRILERKSARAADGTFGPKSQEPKAG